MTMLAEVTDSRENHFDLIRMVAALAVLVSHAWPIALGKGTAEPLQALTGHSLGSLAVFVFFAISGFLISASFARSRRAVTFFVARGLRIIPALAVSSWLIALGLGPLVTDLPVADYLRHRETWAFVLRNSVPLSHIFTLPEVFAQNPYPHPVGSIWTLPNEVACYGIVLLLGMMRLLDRRGARAGLTLALAGLWLLPAVAPVTLPQRAEALHMLALPFLCGMACFLWRDVLPIRGQAAAAIAATLALLAGLARQGPAADVAVALALAYGTLWLAHRPAPALCFYRRLGDYSYGTYLYAFPLQGLVVWLFGPMTPVQNIALALPPTLICAVLSWHLVERPALGLRRP